MDGDGFYPAESKSLLAGRRLVTVKGEWWLWVYMAYWKIVQDGGLAARNSSSLKAKQKVMGFLEGQYLKNVEINNDNGCTRFLFDQGGELEVRRFEKDSEDELWLLYKPSGYVLTVTGDGSVTHEPGSGIDRRVGVVGRKLKV